MRGDFWRSELNDVDESLTCLNAFPKSEKSWKSEKSKQIVMNEKLVKNSVMNAKFDPKVVMHLSIIQNCWMGKSTAQQPKFIGRVHV